MIKLVDNRVKQATHIPMLVKTFELNEAKIEKHWGMVLVDHSPDERRWVEIKRLANLAKYIVIHDTDWV